MSQSLLAPAYRFLKLLLPVTMVASTALAPTRASAETPQIPEDLQAQLYTALRQARQHSIAPGLSMSVVTADGRQWSGADGWHPNGEWLHVDDPLVIGSVTKTFTAATVLELIAEGRVKLDAPTTTYLHNVRLVKGTTIRQLLTHTSGIRDLYGPALGVLQGSPNQSLTSNGVLRPIGGPYFPAGKGYHYSNTNYYLLGLVIEHVTGRTVQEEIQDRFLTPLGLERTALLTPANPYLPAAWTTAFWTSGAMIATPTDLARWGEALYTGHVLSKAGLHEMLDFTDGHYYGAGAQKLPLGGRWVPGHSGLLYDTTTLLVNLPAEKITIAIAATAPSTDLEGALVDSYGGPSLLELVQRLVG